MANSTADCHVTGFFEGLLSTKTPRIFVSTYTATNPTNSASMSTIDKPTTAVKERNLNAAPGAGVHTFRKTREPPRLSIDNKTSLPVSVNETLVDNQQKVLETGIIDNCSFQGEQTESTLKHRLTETISEVNSENEKGENKTEKEKRKNSTVNKSNPISKRKKENDHDGTHLSDDFLATDSGREESRNSNPSSIYSNKNKNVSSSKDKDVMDNFVCFNGGR